MEMIRTLSLAEDQKEKWKNVNNYGENHSNNKPIESQGEITAFMILIVAAFEK